MLHHSQQLLPTSTDLKIITTYLAHSNQPQVQPRNLSELSGIIKNRLATRNKDREQKITCREWLREKGMNIQPLIEYLSYKTTAKEPHISEPGQAQQPSKFVTMQPILFNHEQYCEKALQYASTNLLKFISTKREFRKRQFKATMMRLGCGAQDNSLPLIKPLQCSQSPRDKQKRDKYIATVKRLLDAQLQSALKKDSLKDYIEDQNAARLFFEGTPHKLWKILFHQVKGVNFESEKDWIITEMLINSLRLIEEQFDQDLPVNKQAVTYYLQQKYLNKFQKPGQYIFHHQHGSLWGKAFLYFRAGRLTQTIELLETAGQRQLVRDIEVSTDSIMQKSPRKIRIDSMLMKGVSDVFRQQILYALGGQRKYSSDVLSDPMALDCVWILLRNTGIYYHTDKHLFEEIRHQMIEFYNRQQLQRQRIFFSSYLLDYDSLAKCNECQSLDRDDLMHLLLLLRRYPSLIQNKEYLQSRLTEYAVSYAAELAAEEREQYIYYILVIPPDRLVEAASSLIVNSKLFSSINWRKLMQYLPEDQFRSLLTAASQKYTVFTSNYLEAAHTVVDLVIDKRSGLNMLTKMLIQHVKQKKIYGGEDITKALRIYSNWVEDQVEDVYSKLLELLQNVVHLSRALLDRNYRKVGDLVNSNNFLFGEHLNYIHRQMLAKLLSFNGIEVFFILLSSLMRAADIILTRDSHPQELKQYKHSLYITANTVINDQHFRKACQTQPILELLQELSAGLIQNSIENYMNYN